MNNEKRFIVTGLDFQRKDLLAYFDGLEGKAVFYFIEFLNANEAPKNSYAPYGSVLYWKDYDSAFELLERIKPDAVLFFLLETIHHVALNYACIETRTPTIHIEHGLRSLKLLKQIEQFNPLVSTQPKSSTLHKLVQALLSSELLDRYKNRRFFTQTIRNAPQEAKQFFNHYLNFRPKHNFRYILNYYDSPYLRLGHYVSFCPRVFDYHIVTRKLKPDQKVSFIGLPSTDSIFGVRPVKDNSLNILFIDQPFHELSILGWKESDKRAFVDELLALVARLGVTLYIKPHPSSDLNFWQDCTQGNPHIKLVVNNDAALRDAIADTGIALGFYSTLLMPLMAYDHVVTFCLEVHPYKTVPLSEIFTDTGAAKTLFSLDELETILTNPSLFSAEKRTQQQAKAAFIQEWMYAFDGKATQRLHAILLGT